MNDIHIVSHYHDELRSELKHGHDLYVTFPDIDEYTQVDSYGLRIRPYFAVLHDPVLGSYISVTVTVYG